MIGAAGFGAAPRKPTRADFRRHLNAADEADRAAGRGRWYNGRLGPTARPYGDYLYAQDRDMFEFEYQRWIDGGAGRPASSP